MTDRVWRANAGDADPYCDADGDRLFRLAGIGRDLPETRPIAADSLDAFPLTRRRERLA